MAETPKEEDCSMNHSKPETVIINVMTFSQTHLNSFNIIGYENHPVCKREANMLRYGKAAGYDWMLSSLLRLVWGLHESSYL